MFTDIINRQAFEFTCKAEETAARIRHEIEAHAAAQINHIISSIFSQAIESSDYLKIDKLEIDLGDITVNDFGNREMLSRLKEMLEQKIAGIKNSRYHTDAEKRNSSILESSEIQNELEVIRSFILHGDVPWWVDKNNPLNLDAIVQKIIHLNPQPLKLFIEEHIANPDVISRLFTQMKPATVSKIRELIPDLSQTLLKERFFDDNIPVEIDSLSPTQIKKLRTIFNKNGAAPIDKVRQQLVSRLIQLRRLVQMKKISVEGTALERLLLTRNAVQLLSLISSPETRGRRKERKEKKEITSSVKRLTIFEAELLLFELSTYPAAGSIFFDNGLNNPVEDLFTEAVPVIQTVQPGKHYQSNESADNNNDDIFPRDAENKIGNNDPVSYANGNKNDSKTNDPLTLINKTEELKPGFENIDKETGNTGDDILQQQAQNKTNNNDHVSNTEENRSDSKTNDPSTVINRTDELKAGFENIDKETGNTVDSDDWADKPGPGFENIGKQNLPISNILNKNDEIVPGLPHIAADSDDISNYRPGEKKQLPDFTESQWQRIREKDQRVARVITFIMKRLNTSDVVLLRYLQQLEINRLEQMSEIFKRRERERTERKQIVAGLLEHPHLMKYNILKVFANLAFSKEEKSGPGFGHSVKNDPEKKSMPVTIAAKLQSYQSAFLAIIKDLPEKDYFIIKDVFQKGSFDTKNEKSLAKKTLLKLSRENIMLLKFLTELPPHEIEKLLPSPKDITFQNDKPGSNEGIPFYTDKEQQNIYIENAGLCLLAVYLPGLFKRLGYLENGIFRNKGFAIRAIYILQYITSGKSKSPEYLLQFNKLLCGLRIDDYITKSVRLTKKEIFETGSLLESVIGNWNVLKNTSVNGLRESFFKRKGILFESGMKWTLQVERKGYDLLLNTIPWNYGIIKLPWMNKIIQVEW